MEEIKSLDRKWFNYFSNMRNKYNMRISANKPLIIFLDAKDSSNNHFFDAMKLTAKYFTSRYKCIAIWKNDEISFIIEDIENFIDSINNEKSYKTHDIASVFSQYFFEYFNNVYEGENIYWHCKCFNISKEKIQSYIKFKSKGILNYNGRKIDLNEYLNGNIAIVEEKENVEFFDLMDFDKSI